MGAIFCQRITVGCRQMSPNCPFWFFEPAQMRAPLNEGVIIKALRTTETLLCRQNGCNRISNGIKTLSAYATFQSRNHYFYYCLSLLVRVKMNCNSYEMHLQLCWLDDEIIWGNFSTFSRDSKLGWKAGEGMWHFLEIRFMRWRICEISRKNDDALGFKRGCRIMRTHLSSLKIFLPIWVD